MTLGNYILAVIKDELSDWWHRKKPEQPEERVVDRGEYQGSAITPEALAMVAPPPPPPPKPAPPEPLEGSIEWRLRHERKKR